MVRTLVLRRRVTVDARGGVLDRLPVRRGLGSPIGCVPVPSRSARASRRARPGRGRRAPAVPRCACTGVEGIRAAGIAAASPSPGPSPAFAGAVASGSDQPVAGVGIPSSGPCPSGPRPSSGPEPPTCRDPSPGPPTPAGTPIGADGLPIARAARMAWAPVAARVGRDRAGSSSAARPMTPSWGPAEVTSAPSVRSRPAVSSTSRRASGVVRSPSTWTTRSRGRSGPSATSARVSRSACSTSWSKTPRSTTISWPPVATRASSTSSPASCARARRMPRRSRAASPRRSRAPDVRDPGLGPWPGAAAPSGSSECSWARTTPSRSWSSRVPVAIGPREPISAPAAVRRTGQVVSPPPRASRTTLCPPSSTSAAIRSPTAATGPGSQAGAGRPTRAVASAISSKRRRSVSGGVAITSRAGRSSSAASAGPPGSALPSTRVKASARTSTGSLASSAVGSSAGASGTRRGRSEPPAARSARSMSTATSSDGVTSTAITQPATRSSSPRRPAWVLPVPRGRFPDPGKGPRRVHGNGAVTPPHHR